MVTRLALGCVSYVFLILIKTDQVWGQVDLTRNPGASGVSVVEAVIDLIHHNCIFEDDKFFLRRLAFVESGDGTDSTTYRHGYDGGIWQVDIDKFLQTQNSSYTQRYFSNIRSSNLHIDWSQVTWGDLRQPLYSGLAARLYIEVMNRGRDIPREISQQAQLWRQNYHNSYQTPTSNFTSSAQLITRSCSGDKPLDAVFILDSSGSVGSQDFEKAKQFVIKWIEAFQIGPTATQLAVISYSSQTDVQFDLNTYHNSSDLINRVRRIQYIGGGTNTAGAIDVAVNRSLSAKYGLRNDAAHAAVLVTDGQSNDRRATIIAAESARKNLITMFAVGVGRGVDMYELNAVATDPTCTHVFLVGDFSEIEELKEQMQKATCETKIQLAEPNATNRCELREGKSCGITVPGKNTTNNGSQEAFVTTVNCGNATVYAAYNNPNPGEAYYEIKSVATPDEPSIIYLQGDGRSLFITIEGQLYRLDANSSIVCEAVSKVVEIEDDEKVDVTCNDHGVQRECTPDDLIDFKEELCKVSWDFPNPCTREHLLEGQLKFPHPHHVDRYLMCDFTGKVYIVQCPQGHVYNNITDTCEPYPGNPGHFNFTRVPMDPDMVNPCTVEAVLAGHMLFADAHDRKKFITCDVWGNAWLSDCPDKYIWDPKDMRCVVDNSIGHVQGPGPLEPNVPNPCTQERIAAGLFYFPYPYARSLYIQCDAWGGAYVMVCFPGGVWSDTAKVCTVGNLT